MSQTHVQTQSRTETRTFSPSLLLEKNPKQVIESVKSWLNNPSLDFGISHRVVGRGFPPVAITLGGAVSAAGLIVSASIFKDRLRYIVTSPEVANAQGGPLLLSRQVLEKVVETTGYEVVVVPFDILSGGYAERMRAILRQGSLIVNGVSAEFAIWLGRNAGIGRLLVYRPENNIATYKFL